MSALPHRAWATRPRGALILAIITVVVAAISTAIAQQPLSRGTAVSGQVVDEGGMPVADARVLALGAFSRRAEATAGADGKFTVRIDWRLPDAILIAQNAAGDMQGSLQFPQAQQFGGASPVLVTLRKPAEVSVSVMNPNKEPLAGVRVGLNARHQITPILAAEQTTDETGRVVLRVPSDLSLDSIFAVKRGVGVNYNTFSVGQVGSQTIVLGNNLRFQIQAVDDEDKHLADVEITPSSIRNAGGNIDGRSIVASANFQISGFPELPVKTDANGTATIDTLPADITSRAYFNLKLAGHTVIQGVSFDPRSEMNELKAVLVPLVELHGRVVNATGQPSPRAEVHVFGAGYKNGASTGSSRLWFESGDNCVGFRTTCDASGEFKLQVAHNQYYALLAVTPQSEVAFGGKRAEISAIQFQTVRSDTPTGPLTLTLKPATKIYGTATQALARGQSQPFRSPGLRLVWRDPDSYAKLPPDQRLANRNNDPRPIVPSFVVWMNPDANGKFFCYVPPGHYKLTAPPYVDESAVIEVHDQPEIEVNFQVTRPGPEFARAAAVAPPADVNMVELKGHVVLATEHERPLGGVPVRRINTAILRTVREQSYRDTTTEDGAFHLMRAEIDVLLSARTADGLLASIIKVPPDKNDAVIQLSPTATIVGRVVQSQTGKPLAGREIDIMIPTGTNTSTSGDAHAITNADGRFVLSGIPTRWPVRISLAENSEPDPRTGKTAFGARRWHTLASVTPESAGIIDFGSLSDRSEVQMSPLHVLSDATRIDIVQTGRLEDALGQAELSGQQVLVVAGLITSDIYQQFATLWWNLNSREQGEAILDTSSQYTLLAIDTSRLNVRVGGNREIIQRAQIEPPAASDLGLSILRPDGDVVTVTTAEQLSRDGKLDTEKMAEFLRKYDPPKPDAMKLLDGAIAEAQATGKRVLAFQHVPLSSPSALWSLFFDRQREALAKDYVCVRWNRRFENAEQAIARIGGNVKSTVPIIAVVDAGGKPLVTSHKHATASISESSPGATFLRQLLDATAATLTADEKAAVCRFLWVP